MVLYDFIFDIVGNIFIVRLQCLVLLQVSVYVKVELFNLGGLVKDCLVLVIIFDVEVCGLFKLGDMIVEVILGNIGVVLVMVVVVCGYKFVVIMVEIFLVECCKLMCVYGVKVILILVVECGSGMVCRVVELVEQYGWFLVSQFVNLVNLVYYCNIIVVEILCDFVGKWLDYFVSGWGIGGMFIGVGEVLKVVCLQICIIVIELVGVVLFKGDDWKLYKIQGWILDFVLDVFNCDVVDELVLVEDDCVIVIVCCLVVEEGIFVGIFVGVIVVSVLDIVVCVELGLVIFVMLLDIGECYFFMLLFVDVNEGFDDDWLVGLL